MWFPPGLALIIAGFLIAGLPGNAFRRALVIVGPAVTLALVWLVPEGDALQLIWLSEEVVPLKGDSLSRLFGTVFTVMALAGGVYALGARARKNELSAAFIYAGGAIGACFAGDLISLFVFWEIMALASTIVIWSTGNALSAAAGRRYLVVHLFGGALLMIGIAGHWFETSSISFGVMGLDSPAHWLILAGFLINAGAPPLSAWLPDAYPETSPSGMVFLSAFTTKTAVYAILRGFAGEEVLIYFGLFMVFYGIIYALLENDMRRILAYSIINQVGFMITGAGIGTALAVNGAAAHAFTHIIYKALLLMSAGAVIHMTGQRKCTDLGGLYRTMPLTLTCGIVGALAISAFPFTSGFVSKSMISQAASDGNMATVWYLLAAASAGVFLHAGIKFPWFVFFQKDSGLRPQEPPLLMRSAMIALAALCILIGVAPGVLYEWLPYQVDYAPYTGGHVGTQLQLLLFAGLAFFLMLPQMKRTLTITLDVDWFYRRAGMALMRAGAQVIDRAATVGRGMTIQIARQALHMIGDPVRPNGLIFASWPTGLTALWILLILATCLFLYYI